MELLFWLSLALVVYIYVGYPIVIKLLAACPKKIAFDATAKCIFKAFSEVVTKSAKRKNLTILYILTRLICHIF